MNSMKNMMKSLKEDMMNLINKNSEKINILNNTLNQLQEEEKKNDDNNIMNKFNRLQQQINEINVNIRNNNNKLSIYQHVAYFSWR